MTKQKNQHHTRRNVLKTGIKFALGLPFLGTHLPVFSSSAQTVKQATKPLKILILGGTSFLGPHQIAWAISRGHSISTFTRGKTKATVHQQVFEQVEQLIGDRDSNLTALEGKQWDVVIDNSGRNAEWTKQSAHLLKDQAGLYIYVSSVSVYFPFLTAGVDENSRVLLNDPQAKPVDGVAAQDSYSVMKAKSERAAIQAFSPERTTIIRPTFIVGPGDLTDRFIHWPVRLAKGGDVLVPGKVDDPVQYIDVRDLAKWMIHLAEQKVAGTFNAAGPERTQTMHEFVAEASKSFAVPKRLIHVDDEAFLANNQLYGVVPWVLPSEQYFGMTKVKNSKAIEAGLTFRSLISTIQDTHQWWYSDALSQARRDEFELTAGSLLVNEKSLLKSWHLRPSSG